ncbi:hypothetical protein [Ferrimonas senticii]|uniref:hypothetical protein n=1 Tax=Ferrimonas senticii TaxID=394566 RepID=UPI00041D0B4E|nr:hypothetical protein [Ferrimonas senticii]
MSIWDNVKNLIGNTAPVLGSLLGGGAGEKVGGMIAAALGVDNNPESIEQALRDHPELLLELKRLEQQHRTQLNELQLAELQIHANSEAKRLSGIAHARETLRDHPMVSLMSIGLLLLACALLWIVSSVTLPDANRDLAVFIFGQIITFVGMSVQFWFGTPKDNRQPPRNKHDPS